MPRKRWYTLRGISSIDGEKSQFVVDGYWVMEACIEHEGVYHYGFAYWNTEARQAYWESFVPNGIDDEDGETYDINNESYFAFQENPNPVFSATEYSVFVCGEKVSWLSEGSDDPACTGGALGGEYGWHHGGKQLFFGTIGVLLSGGTLAAGGLTAYGVAFETGNIVLNVDDISMGIFADGETSFSTKLGLDNSVVEKLKFCGDATSFLKGLMGELQGVISSMEEVARTGKMTESQLEVWNAANIAFDQLQTLLGGYELLEPEKK